MNNKPRKPCFAAFWSFCTIGLGHVYSGEAGRGVVLHLGGYLILAAWIWLLLRVKLDGVILFSGLAVLIGYYLWCLIDAVRAARQKAEYYEVKPYNKACIYLLLLFLLNLVGQPIAAYFAYFIKKDYVQAYKFPSGSMSPTLLSGDRILVSKSAYKHSDPQRNDLIVFEFPKDPSMDYIKRVIAVAGDTVEIKDKKVVLNGVPQQEEFAVHEDTKILPESAGPRDYLPAVAVPKNSLFVMGDNRDNSFDSRFWGFVNKSKVKGKVMTIYWSWDKDNGRVRWERIGRKIQ